MVVSGAVAKTGPGAQTGSGAGAKVKAGTRARTVVETQVEKVSSITRNPT